MKPDPLAGKREAINAGEIEAIVWRDEGKGCPVKAGDLFKLRSCHIEITKTHRVLKKGRPAWRAEFVRLRGDKVLILGRRSGYTSDLKGAMRAQDDPKAGTLDRPDELTEQQKGLGPEPEPEAVPHDELRFCPASQQARARYEHEHGEEAARHRSLPVAVRLELVREQAQRSGIDLTRQFARINQAIEAAESKVQRLSKMPSDKAA